MSQKTKVDQLNIFDFPVEESKKDWFERFNDNLKNKRGFTHNSKPLLMVYQNSQGKNPDKPIYKDDRTELIPEKIKAFNDYNLAWHKFDPLKHLRKRKDDPDKYADPFEKIFVKKCPKCNIIVNDKIIQDNKMDYHVVILDATRDYMMNYFPLVKQFAQDKSDDIKQDFAQSSMLNEFAAYPAIKIAVFVNNNGSYFLALPFLLSRYDIAVYASTPKTAREDFPAFNVFDTKVVNTTLAEVSRILADMPLVSLAKDELDNEIQERIPASITHGNYLIQGETVARFADIVMHKPYDERNLGYNNGYYALNFNQINNKDTKIELIECWSRRILCKYTTEVYDAITFNNIGIELLLDMFLNSHLRVKIQDDKSYLFYLDIKSNPAWDELLNEYKMFNLSGNGSCRANNKYFTAGLRLYWDEDVLIVLSRLVKEYMKYHVQFNKPKEDQIVESVDLINKPNVEKLASSSGLQKILETIIPGKNHRYYLDDARIWSLYGSNKLNYAEDGYYDDEKIRIRK